MSPVTKIVLGLAIPGIVLIAFLMIPPHPSPDPPSRSTAQSTRLEIPEEDYANGLKRRAAVFSKVVPGLKKTFVQRELNWGSPIFLRAFKEEGILEIWVRQGDQFVLFREYPILAGSGKIGPKLAEGDLQVPEGFYEFGKSQMNPQSQFHLSFNIGYPNAFDRAHGRTGSFIMVHGSNVSVGCLPIGDDKVEEVFTLAHHAFEAGQRRCQIHLFPFRLTPEKLDRHRESPWASFWENLREGYQWFESRKIPPEVVIREKRYCFE